MAQTRMTISLPPKMAATVEAVSKAEHRTRSEVVREALRRYLPRPVTPPSVMIRELGFANRGALARALKEGARKRSARDRALAGEWLSIDEEAWRDLSRG